MNSLNLRPNGMVRIRAIDTIILISTALLAGLLVWLAPAERTLGQGIKIVYIHVGFIWTGMSGFVLAAVLGSVVLVTGSRKVQFWMQNVSWVALCFFAVGLTLSLLASKINWGAVYFREPRMLASLRFLGAAILILVASRWLPWIRIRGLLSLALVIFMMWSILGTPLILHPESPIRSSGAAGIKFSFLGFYLLCLSLATWTTWYVHRAKHEIRETHAE